MKINRIFKAEYIVSKVAINLVQFVISRIINKIELIAASAFSMFWLPKMESLKNSIVYTQGDKNENENDVSVIIQKYFWHGICIDLHATQELLGYNITIYSAFMIIIYKTCSSPRKLYSGYPHLKGGQSTVVRIKYT